MNFCRQFRRKQGLLTGVWIGFWKFLCNLSETDWRSFATVKKRANRIHRDAVQPGRELSPTVEAVDSTNNSQKDVLRNVVCRLLIQHHRVHHLTNAGEVTGKEFIQIFRPA